jgi:hypothetical protein
MKKGAKIALIVAGSVGTLGLVSALVYPLIMRNGIRTRLDEAFADPSAESAVGGLDKFLVNEAFDTRKFATSDDVTISRLEARERAEQIWGNYNSWFGSNETAIISAFQGLGHLHDVSKISNEFYQSYEEELLQVLKTALSSKGKYNILIGKLSKLPND